QLAQGRARVEVAAAVGDVGVGQEELRRDQVPARERLLVEAHEGDLAGGGRGLEARQLLRPPGKPEARDPAGERARGGDRRPDAGLVAPAVEPFTRAGRRAGGPDLVLDLLAQHLARRRVADDQPERAIAGLPWPDLEEELDRDGEGGGDEEEGEDAREALHRR